MAQNIDQASCCNCFADLQTETVYYGDRKISIRTSVLEEKATACNMLCCYADELEVGFFPYVEQASLDKTFQTVRLSTPCTTAYGGVQHAAELLAGKVDSASSGVP